MPKRIISFNNFIFHSMRKLRIFQHWKKGRFDPWLQRGGRPKDCQLVVIVSVPAADCFMLLRCSRRMVNTNPPPPSHLFLYVCDKQHCPQCPVACPSIPKNPTASHPRSSRSRSRALGKLITTTPPNRQVKISWAASAENGIHWITGGGWRMRRSSASSQVEVTSPGQELSLLPLCLHSVWASLISASSRRTKPCYTQFPPRDALLTSQGGMGEGWGKGSTTDNTLRENMATLYRCEQDSFLWKLLKDIKVKNERSKL